MGKSVVDAVSADLRRAFPGTTGFSPRSLRDRKRFYLTCADRTSWPQVVANLGAEEVIVFLQRLAAEIQLSTLPKIFPLEKIVPGMLNPKMIEDKAKS